MTDVCDCINGEVVGDMPVSALVDECPVYHKPSQGTGILCRQWQIDTNRYEEVTDLEGALEKVLASPTVASKEWVYNQYDHMVRTSTAVRQAQMRLS